MLLALSLDRSLSTATIILIGVVYSMLVSSLLSLLIAFSGNKLRAISFWTMGSLASSSYENVLLLLITLVIAGGILLSRAKALNAFALGEDRALHLGVDIRREKLIVMSCVSILIGVSVSIGGGIAFVGLITPHIMRMLSGPNHKRLLPCCLFGGAVFLMFCDLIARTIVSPIELPIGVVTSLIGAVMFIVIFIRQRSRRIV
ncbi:MAG: iron ABC transporter permease [Clostridia bacterium]|nr:iron ABC transporter permease [Clostridia bacterium]